MNRAALVYQNSIANVFDISGAGDMPELSPFVNPGSGRKWLLQHVFSPCEWFAAGLKACGVTVLVYHCDQIGDCRTMGWETGPGELFKEAKRPPL